MSTKLIYNALGVFRQYGPFSQSDLARYMGASQVSVSRWFHGKAKPTTPHRKLLEYTIKVAETLPDVVLAVAKEDPGENGTARLAAVVGWDVAVRMIGGADEAVYGVAIARLASLIEVTSVLAPSLVNVQPGAVAAPKQAMTLREEAEQAVREYLALEARYKAKTY